METETITQAFENGEQHWFQRVALEKGRARDLPSTTVFHPLDEDIFSILRLKVTLVPVTNVSLDLCVNPFFFIIFFF